MVLFGTPDKVEPVISNSKIRFQQLANKEVDIISQSVTYNMGRDVFESSSQSGFTFSIPYLHFGLGFAGVPEFVNCAEELENFFGNCRYVKVCVYPGSTQEQILEEILPGTTIQVSSPQEFATALEEGRCNVASADMSSMSEKSLRKMGYTGPYVVGTKIFSREPYGLVTRQDDSEWSRLVNAVVEIFFIAESENITKSNAQDTLMLFEDDPQWVATAANIIAEFGKSPISSHGY